MAYSAKLGGVKIWIGMSLLVFINAFVGADVNLLNGAFQMKFGASKYSSAASAARASLVSKGWIFTDVSP